jgi:hypothetical protein
MSFFDCRRIPTRRPPPKLKADNAPADRKVLRLFAEISHARLMSKPQREKEAWDRLARYLMSKGPRP